MKKDEMTRKTTVFYALLLMSLLPMLLFRDFTPANELRYLSIADEALAHHHIFVFTCHGQPYADKPPLFLWLVMLVRLLPAAVQHLAFGLLSVVPGIVTTEVTRRLLGLKGGKAMTFRLVMYSTVLMLVSMLTLRMDMLMAMFIMLAVAEFFRLYTSGKPRESWLLPVFVFLGTFTKGAVGFIMPLGVILAFLMVKGRESDFFRYVGWRSWLLMVLLFAGWFACVYVEGGGAYLYDLTVHQTLGRAFHSFHHRQPVYYYLYMVWPLLLPWSFWMAVSIWRSWRRQSLHGDASRLMTVGCATAFVVLSLISSKLSIYLLPFVPFAVGSTAIAGEGDDGLKRGALYIGYSLMVLLAPVAVALLVVRPDLRFLCRPLVLVAVATLSVGGLCALVLLSRRRVSASVRAMSVSVLVAVFLSGCAVGGLNEWVGYREQCVAARQLSAAHHGAPIVVSGLKHAENMDVFLGSHFRVTTPEALCRMHRVVAIVPTTMASGCHFGQRRQVGPYVVGYITAGE